MNEDEHVLTHDEAYSRLSTWYPNLSLSWCQTMGDCSDQGGPFAAAAVWEDKPDVALWEQTTHNFTETIRIPEMDSVKFDHFR